jgi:hypothetical protein
MLNMSDVSNYFSNTAWRQRNCAARAEREQRAGATLPMAPPVELGTFASTSLCCVEYLRDFRLRLASRSRCDPSPPVLAKMVVKSGIVTVNGKPEELGGPDGRQQPPMGGTSRVSREAQARICEQLGVKFPGPTRPFRVLKPGGRFAVSDVVVRGDVPDQVRRSMAMWVGCIAGALHDDEYIGKLVKSGFGSMGIERTRVYRIEDARQFLTGEGIDADAIAPQAGKQIHERFYSRRQTCAKGVLWSDML